MRRSQASVSRDRWLKTGLPFVPVGPKTVRYRRSDIEEYVENHRVVGSALAEVAR